MAMNQRLMRPRRSGPRPASPSITVIQPGVDEVAEVVTISDGLSEIVNFGDGVGSPGAITFDSQGHVTEVVPPETYSQLTSASGPSVQVQRNFPGDVPDCVKFSGGGGTVEVTTQGVTGASDKWALSLDGATAGTFKITAGSVTTEEINWNDDGVTIASKFQTAFGTTVSVDGTGGNVTITFDFVGAHGAPSIAENALTK